MWGELAAWKISAQLADELEPLEAKLAATSQVHDEARHFYVMHDYLDALGEKAEPMEFWSQRVLDDAGHARPGQEAARHAAHRRDDRAGHLPARPRARASSRC
jgi:hypothetical protein